MTLPGPLPMTPRTRVLPRRGRTLVSTDLHGNLADFTALHARFEAGLAAGEDLHWVLCGDLVHGPSESARRRRPELFDYEDASPTLVEAVLEARRRRPERVHVILGNHDHGHVGGGHTSKFYPDEVEALEARCTAGQRAAIRELFGEALLAVIAPCGALLAHGCPDDRLRAFADLDGVALEVGKNDAYHRHLLATFTCSYGQRREVTRRLLAAVTASAWPVRMMIHGHDVDEDGWFSEGEHQLSPVLFGAPAAARCYLELDLAAEYTGAGALREGHEIRRVHGG